jgi:hypothetical protein
MRRGVGAARMPARGTRTAAPRAAVPAQAPPTPQPRGTGSDAPATTRLSSARGAWMCASPPSTPPGSRRSRPRGAACADGSRRISSPPRTRSRLTREGIRLIVTLAPARPHQPRGPRQSSCRALTAPRSSTPSTPAIRRWSRSTHVPLLTAWRVAVGCRPTQQRAGAPRGASGLLLCREAGVSSCAAARRPARTSDA